MATSWSRFSTIPREIEVVDARVLITSGVARRRLSTTARNLGVASRKRFIVDSNSREATHQSSIMMPSSSPRSPIARLTTLSATFTFSGLTSPSSVDSLVNTSYRLTASSPLSTGMSAPSRSSPVDSPVPGRN